MNADDLLSGTFLTKRWLMESLGVFLQTRASLANVQVSADCDSTTERGCTAKAFRLHLEWTDEEACNAAAPCRQPLPTTVICKAAAAIGFKQVSESGRSDNADVQASLLLGHMAECAFFGYANAADPVWNLAIPKCFHSAVIHEVDNSRVLIVEDLAGSGAIVKWLSVAQLMNVLEQVARLHALSVVDESWKSVHALNRISRAKLMASDSDGCGKLVIRQRFEQIKQLGEERMGAQLARIDELYSSLDDCTYVDSLCEELSMGDVLIHGHLNTDKLVFATGSDDKATDQLLGVVDWNVRPLARCIQVAGTIQLAHAGCAAEDVMRLVCSACGGAERRANGDRLLRHYYSALERMVGARHVPPPFALAALQTAARRLMHLLAVDELVALAADADDDALAADERIAVVEKMRCLLEDGIASLDERRAIASVMPRVPLRQAS